LFLALLVLLCVISSLWAIEPIYSIKRSLFLLIILFILYFSIVSLGIKRIWALTINYLAACAVISIGLAYLSPEIGVHQFASDLSDPTIIGTWRGVFVHKNVAARGFSRNESGNVFCIDHDECASNYAFCSFGNIFWGVLPHQQETGRNGTIVSGIAHGWCIYISLHL
jgi:O-antigen ligase